jgi:hypothetical protein
MAGGVKARSPFAKAGRRPHIRPVILTGQGSLRMDDGQPTKDAHHNSTMSLAEAARRQAAYARSRRAWAQRIGRPYTDDRKGRPPPGEVDAAAEE